MNITSRCSRIGSFSTRLWLLKTIVGRFLGSNAGQRGNLEMFGSPRRANAIQASLTLSASACASGLLAVSVRRLDRVERKRDFDGMGRFQPASVHRRLPAKVVKVDGALAERGPPFGDLHRRRAVRLIARR